MDIEVLIMMEVTGCIELMIDGFSSLFIFYVNSNVSMDFV